MGGLRLRIGVDRAQIEVGERVRFSAFFSGDIGVLYWSLGDGSTAQ